MRAGLGEGRVVQGLNASADSFYSSQVALVCLTCLVGTCHHRAGQVATLMIAMSTC